MKLQTFSQFYGRDKNQYELDFVDIPINNGDIPLFIDPYAISRRNDRWSIKCHNLIVDFFQKVVDLIRAGKETEAKYMLSGLREPNQIHFGLSRGSIVRGRGVGSIQALDLHKALAESSAVKTGFLKNLEDCELLIEGIGRDKISDITTNIIKEYLIEYTQYQCNLFNIPIHQVSSGILWNAEQGKWTNDYVDIPVCNNRSVILVPKMIARFDMVFDHQEYYQHFVLNFLQAEHLSANSSLVRTLRDGTKKEPTKKSLKERYPLTKKYLYEFSKEHPEVLTKYKEEKAEVFNSITNETSNEDIAILIEEEEFDFDDLAKKFGQIPTGNEAASNFHDHIKGVLTAIFYPYLVNPIKEKEIHEGRKRIDLCYDNAAKNGFFLNLAVNKQVPSPYIFMECKNYKYDPKNPELDQLSGRFSKNRGKFGFLVCRKFDDKDLFIKRCKDTANDDRGFILPLDDEDLITLLEYKKQKKEKEINGFLEERYKKLVM